MNPLGSTELLLLFFDYIEKYCCKNIEKFRILEDRGKKAWGNNQFSSIKLKNLLLRKRENNKKKDKDTQEYFKAIS